MAAMALPYVIAVCSGDGIGPEVVAEAIRVLEAVGGKFGHSFSFVEALVGGAAYEAQGAHLPEATVQVCEGSDAILFGSVGGPVDAQHLPKWKDAERNAILGMRKRFSLAINIRPSTVYAALEHLCPLKAEVIGKGVDIVIIRELLGGAYFGLHETAQDGRAAKDEMTYTWEQVEHAVKFGFETCVLPSPFARLAPCFSPQPHIIFAPSPLPPSPPPPTVSVALPAGPGLAQGASQWWTRPMS
jgi:3-isopropylmalate dehydrogenase